MIDKYYVESEEAPSFAMAGNVNMKNINKLNLDRKLKEILSWVGNMG